MPNDAWIVQEVPHVPIEWGFLEELKAAKKKPKSIIENTHTVPVDAFYGRITHQKFKKEMEAIKNNFPTEYNIDNTTLVGIEVEVENIINRPDCAGWRYKEDGSLRNNGAEYVSFPMEAQYVPSALTFLNHSLSCSNEPKWTSRTSIHVHINVQDMSFKQIQAFVVLYLCFESILYAYAGNNRHKSIFCVPLSHAGYIKSLRNLFSEDDTTTNGFLNVFKCWHKYTGFNLRPIHDFGTIEFRHLSGTDDVEYISKWVSLILCLKEAACIYSMEDLFKVISELNTNSEYYIFASNIFKDNMQYIPNNALQSLMEKDVSHIKECFIPNEKTKFDDASFTTSYMYIRNKIQNIKKEAFDDLTLEELVNMIKEQYALYHKTKDPVEREAIALVYRQLTVARDKKLIQQGEV